MRSRWLALVPALLFLGAACAKAHGSNPFPNDAPVQIEVMNRYALPMEVYVVGANTRHRLGTVHPGILSTFVVPQAMVGSGSLELEAQPSAGREIARSGPLLLSPGAVVDFVIAAQLFNSTATVRP